MRAAPDRVPGDEARVSIVVATSQSEAFRVFTEDIDQWWRRGVRYRVAGAHRGFIRIEPGAGGRLFESFERGRETIVVDTGRVTAWEPPSRLVFEWRSVTFAPAERTEVEVLFEPSRGGTRVTVTHRGWSSIRPDHPVRHGQEVAAFIRMMGFWWGGLMESMRQHIDAAEQTGPVQ